jgi:hypothetical protein
VRDALAALCPPAETLEQQLNARFAAQLPPGDEKTPLAPGDRPETAMRSIKARLERPRACPGGTL